MRAVLFAVTQFATTSAFASSVVFGTPVPVAPEIEYVELGGEMNRTIAVRNGDRMLLAWNLAEGAARVDENGAPLDIPAILLPKPAQTSGADVVADIDGWIVGWTIFGFPGETSYLRLARVDRDGAIEELPDLPLPRLVPQGAPLHLAMRAGVLAGAYQMDRWEDGVRVAVFVPDDPELTIVDGELRELVSTSDGYALVLRDRIVTLTADAKPAGEAALPSDFAATDAVAIENDLLIGGHTADGIAIVRLRGGASTVEIVAQFPAKTFDVSIAASAGEIVAGWFTASSASGMWDLYAARVRSDGSVEGPQRLRDAIESSGKWVVPPTAPAVERIEGEWMMIWSEGVRSPFFTWRNLYTTILPASLQPVTNPRLVTFKAVDQLLNRVALFDDVVLVIWDEPPNFLLSDRRKMYAIRIGLDGRRVDATPISLGESASLSVRASNTGFVIFRDDAVIRMGAQGPPIYEPPVPNRPNIACAADVCIAAWIEDQTSIRFAEWRDRIVEPVITIHASDRPIEGFGLSSDRKGFLLAFKRPGIPGGSILSATRIERGEDGWTHRTSDFAASPMELSAPGVVRQADRYLLFWRSGREFRGSHLTLEGHSMDGDETGWEGWPLILEGYGLRDVTFDGTRVLFLMARWPRADLLYELRGRTAVVVGGVAGDAASLECTHTGRCAVVYESVLTGDPWYRATRAFLQQFWFGRPRAVRH